MRNSFFSLIVLFVVASSQVRSQDINTKVLEIERLSAAFESACVRLDIETARALVLPEAPAFLADGKPAVKLLESLEDRAKRKKVNEPDDPVRVLHREVVVRENVAVVTELFGATADIAAGIKNQPLRWMVTWSKTNDGWKVAGMHSSPYDSWEQSIVAYEEADKKARYAPGTIVFVGSSSIRGWKTLSEDFADLPVLGRGFGGSQLTDSIMYAHRIVTPYKPSAVAVYAGDNDIAAGKTADRVLRDFKTLVDTIHAADPKIRIGFIAIKPSLKRWAMWDEMKSANERIAKFAASQDLVTYLDIATPMLGEDGRPQPELFVEDGLHLSRPGYDLWTEVVMPWAKGE